MATTSTSSSTVYVKNTVLRRSKRSNFGKAPTRYWDPAASALYLNGEDPDEVRRALEEVETETAPNPVHSDNPLPCGSDAWVPGSTDFDMEYYDSLEDMKEDKMEEEQTKNEPPKPSM